jgi:ribonuclease HII
MKRNEYIIGIDEVGRGSLAGPVTVAAVALPRNFQFSIFNFQKKFKLRDSKKLSPRQREFWFQHITQMNADIDADKRRSIRVNQRRNLRQSTICYAVTSVSPKVIDKIGISNAANFAASRATEKVIANCRIANYKIFLDGGLYLKNIRVNPRSNPLLSASTIIQGDEKIPAIMLASIIAKVIRDRLMIKLHKKYPQYGFDKHKGYGTKFHIKAIRKFGPSPIHRQSFRVN